MPTNAGQQHRTIQTEPRHVTLAREAVERGWTIGRIAQALRARLRRDEHYLAYRQLKGHHTPIDEEIQGDLYPLALAAYYLEECVPASADLACAARPDA